MNNYKCEDCNGGRACGCKPAPLAQSPHPPALIIAPYGDFVPKPTLARLLWDYLLSLLAAVGLLSTVLAVTLYFHGFFPFFLKELSK